MNPFIQQLLNAARNTAGRATTAIDVQARRNMGPQIRRVLDLGALNPYSNPIVSAAKKDPSKLTAFAKATLATPGAKPILAFPVGFAALDPRAPGVIEGGLNQVAPTLDRFFGAVTPRAVQDFGKNMQQFGWGALGGFVPGETSAASVPIKDSAPSLRNYGPGYKEKELAAGAAAERFRPGAGFPGQQGVADRSYQQEKARVTQMTEQDPMFKKYQVAELTKAYNTASPEEKNKIGLQIWAATNPELAKKVPPGQVGYQTAASMFGSQAFGTNVPGVTETIYSQAGQQEGVPGGTQFPSAEQATKMNAFSMGADAQQLGVTPPGTAPFPMIGENVFKRGFEMPSSEDLSQTQLALLKRAFESRIK